MSAVLCIAVVGVLAAGCNQTGPPRSVDVPEVGTYEQLTGLSPADVASLLADIQLFPGAESHSGPTDDPITKASAFPQWRRFEDDVVSFVFPADVGLKVVVHSSTPGDKEFRRSYTLCREGKGYLCLDVDATGRYSEWDCDCGHVWLYRYLYRNGALFRFDLLDSAEPKRAQARRQDRCATFGEWTHCEIHPRTYLMIALSLRIKGPAGERRELFDATVSQEGWVAKLGFLDRGMSRQQVVELLGPPVREDGDVLVYEQTECLRTTVYRVPVPDGRFGGFADGWQKDIYKPLKRGSLAWVYVTATATPYRPGPVGETFDLDSLFDNDHPIRIQDVDLHGEYMKRPPKLPETEARYILDRICALAPGADESQREMLARAAGAMAARGHRLDKRILAILRDWCRRYEDPEATPLATLLHCQPSRTRNFLVELIRERMQRAHKVAETPSTQPAPEGPTDVGYFLMAVQGDPRHSALALEAIQHPDPDIRADGYSQWEALGDALSDAQLRKALDDPSPSVRYYVIEALAGREPRDEHLRWLQDRRARETTDFILRHLEEAIKQLGERRPDAPGEPAVDSAPAPGSPGA